MLGMSHGADPPCCVNIKFFIMAVEYTARTAENQRVCIALSQKRRVMFFVCSPITETAMHIYQMKTSQKCEGLLLACIFIYILQDEISTGVVSTINRKEKSVHNKAYRQQSHRLKVTTKQNDCV